MDCKLFAFLFLPFLVPEIIVCECGSEDTNYVVEVKSLVFARLTSPIGWPTLESACRVSVLDHTLPRLVPCCLKTLMVAAVEDFLRMLPFARIPPLN